MVEAPWCSRRLLADHRRAGAPRSLDGAVDIGAIQVQPWTLTVNSADSTPEIGSTLSLSGALS